LQQLGDILALVIWKYPTFFDKVCYLWSTKTES